MKIQLKKLTLLMVSLASFYHCDTNDDTNIQEPIDPVEEYNLSENVEIYKKDLQEDSYVLTVEAGSTNPFILNKEGFKVFEWNFDHPLGNDMEIIDENTILANFRIDNPYFSFGGYGGITRIMDANGNIEWEYQLNTPNQIPHHDSELLPNGNVLLIVWERIATEEAQANGVNTETDIYPEALLEINPETNETVWEWHSWDHIVQEYNSELPNYKSIANNPNLININYNTPAEDGNIMHSNGLDYDASKDVIYMSINFYNEVWVIDHSTSTEEAASHTGGNYGKGGDLVYRFGNPNTYNNTNGEQILFRNHCPRIIEEGLPGSGNILIFNNGQNIEKSIVYELHIPDFNLAANTNNEPEIVWSYSNDELFTGRVSGATRTPNGNTLICEGNFGLWEVTPEKEVVWKYNNQGVLLWRAYNIQKDSDLLNNISIEN